MVDAVTNRTVDRLLETPPPASIDEWRTQMASFYAFGELIAGAPVDAMLRSAERADEIGPFVDPTGWRDSQRAREDDRDLLRALAKFRSSFLAIRERAIARAAGAR